MKKLFGVGIFILSFVLMVGMSFGMSYESAISPKVFNTWHQVVSPIEVEPNVFKMGSANMTKINRNYIGVDLYVLVTPRGGVLIAYSLHGKDGNILHYEMNVLTDTYVEVESLEYPGFMERLNAGLAKRTKIRQEHIQ